MVNHSSKVSPMPPPEDQEPITGPLPSLAASPTTQPVPIQASTSTPHELTTNGRNFEPDPTTVRVVKAIGLLLVVGLVMAFLYALFLAPPTDQDPANPTTASEPLRNITEEFKAAPGVAPYADYIVHVEQEGEDGFILVRTTLLAPDDAYDSSEGRAAIVLCRVAETMMADDMGMRVEDGERMTMAALLPTTGRGCVET